jgi:hypothetical protein
LIKACVDTQLLPSYTQENSLGLMALKALLTVKAVDFNLNAIKLRNLLVARRSGLPVLKGLAVLANPLT